MNKIEIVQNGDVYSCDIGISKDEWLDLLKDKSMPVSYKEVIIQLIVAHALLSAMSWAGMLSH